MITLTNRPSLPSWRTTVDFLGSYRLSVSLLVGLMVLTWLGTLYQIEHGLYDAQKLYFESFVVLQHPADVWVDGRDGWLDRLPFVVPFPGGMTLMGLLAINLVIGGFVRVLARMGRGAAFLRRSGVLVTHFGIAVLLAAGIVRHQTAVEGNVTLYEGQRASTYRSFHEWEIAVRRQVADGEVEELLIPGGQFLDLAESQVAVFHSGLLPFAVRVEAAARHAEVRPVSAPMPGSGVPGVGGEGFALSPKPRETSNERNIAGAVVALESDGSTGLDDRRAVLSGLDREPWVVESTDGSIWALELRKKTYPLPFTIRLDEFEAEMHPGTRKAKSYRSRVTVTEDGRDRSVLVQMNEPLRSDGLVVYQSSWGPQGAAPGTPLFSGFQVVENVTDQWPLWGCVIIAIGMCLAFGSTLVRFVWRESRSAAATVVLACVLVPCVGQAQALPADHPPVAQVVPSDGSPGDGSSVAESWRTTPWPVEMVERFRRVPVQSDGRIKPFHTVVGYLLLRLHGTRSLRVPNESRYGDLAGVKLGPTEWALDALLFPAQADRYPAFLVQTSEVLDAIGVAHDDKKKRDRYSFDELRAGFDRLFELASEYDAIAEKQRTGLQEQVVALARNVRDYDRLVRSFDAARIVFRTDDLGPELRGLAAQGAGAVRYSQLLAQWAVLRNRRSELAAMPTPGAEQLRERKALDRIVGRAENLSRAEALLRWIPPMDVAEKEWCSAPELIHVFSAPRTGDARAVLGLVARHEAMLTSLGAEDGFESLSRHVQRLSEDLDTWLRVRREGAHLAMEVAYRQASYFYRALLLFVAAFVAVAISWFRPRSRWFALPPWGLSVGGVAVLVYGIVIRCIVRQRPPISTLYDTILFVAGTAVVASLVLEAWHRRRVFLSMAALLGALGMFLAMRFELSEGRDTMPTLVAVLDTNFWLATHVTVINMGYAGALLAGFLAHVFLIGQALGMRRSDASFFRDIGRATYGTVCFAALFTTVGTILGGIWANDSWGRFWGWDPKENGALMIVLWCLAILHARLGNMVRDHGIAMMCVAGNIVVVFSWFHTNLLGVGLHSYGFASGLATVVWSFYGSQLAVLAIGWWGHRRNASVVAA